MNASTIGQPSLPPNGDHSTFTARRFAVLCWVLLEEHVRATNDRLGVPNVPATFILRGRTMARDFYGAGRPEKELRAEERAYSKAGYEWPPSGRLHTCDVCGKEGLWVPGWSWYGSIEDIEGKYSGYTVVRDPRPDLVLTTCSDDCREQASAAPIKGKCRLPMP